MVSELRDARAVFEVTPAQEIEESNNQIISENTLPRITPDMLPNSISEWVQDVCERINTPFEIGAVTALTILGNLIGSQVGVRPKTHDDWTIYPNLWGMIIGEPSTKKTPVFRELEKSLKRLYKQAQQDFKRDMEAYEKKAELIKAKIKDLESNKALSEEVKAKKINDIKSSSDLIKPIKRRYTTSDATIEALADICIENPRGILQKRDELTGFFTDLNKKGRESDRAFYLEGWNGKVPKEIDRVGRGSTFIESLTLGVFGNIQPDKIKKYVHETMNGHSDGLLQRFQLAVFVDPIAYKWVDNAINKKARDEFDKLIAFFTQEEFVGMQTDTYSDTVHFYRLNDSAKDLFREWDEKNAIAAQGMNKELGSHLLKYSKLVCSLALIFHVCDIQEGYDVSDGITYGSLDKAIRISEVMKAHAERLYNTFEIEEQKRDEQTDKILIFLSDKTLPISFRDVTLKAGGKPNKKTIQNAIKGIYRSSGSMINSRLT